MPRSPSGAGSAEGAGRVGEGSLYHVELRQFPNTARKFNLTSEHVRTRILAPWLLGHSVEFDDRRFSPEKARLTIYEGPRLSTDQIGLGRGWANVTRSGRDVTTMLLDRARADSSSPADRATEWVRAEIVHRAAHEPRSLNDVLDLLNLRYPAWRASDRLAVAERAVWELLHRGEITLLRHGHPVPEAEWEALILSFEVWAENDSDTLIATSRFDPPLSG